MANIAVANVAEAVAAAYDEAVAAYERGLQRDTARKVSNARPGETIRMSDRIEDADISNDVSASIGAAREKAMKAITRGMERTQKKLTDAPDSDATNYIVSISQRDDMTADEIEAALSRYKGHAAQHAIRAAAKRSGVKQYAGPTDAEREMEAYRTLAGKVGEYFSPYAISGPSFKNSLARQTFINIGNDVMPGSLEELNIAFQHQTEVYRVPFQHPSGRLLPP